MLVIESNNKKHIISSQFEFFFILPSENSVKINKSKCSPYIFYLNFEKVEIRN